MKNRYRNLKKRGSNWFLRIKINGRETLKTLQTPDRELAAKRAAKLRAELTAGNWDVLLEVGRPRSWSTLGAVIAAYRAYCDGADVTPRTVRENISCLLRIVRAVKGQAFDAEAARADLLTADLVRDYQAALIAAAKPAGPVAIDKAKTTAQSTARQARSLFSRRALASAPYRDLLLPDLSGFLTAPLERGERRAFREPSPEIMAKTLKAVAALRQQNPARWLALVLAANLGLRRGEAVAARWDWVTTRTLPTEDGGTVTTHVMEIIKRDDFDPKGTERRVSIHPEVWAGILELREPSAYILPGTTPAARAVLFRENAAWLRKLGWEENKPNHALRKLFGSEFATRHGLYAAQSALGHSDPRLTSQIYATFLDRGKVVKVL